MLQRRVSSRTGWNNTLGMYMYTVDGMLLETEYITIYTCMLLWYMN